MERKVDVLVISDVHLGTFGCQAKELLLYLQSVKPQILILNGDIVDGWQFRRKYFPASHLEVIFQIMKMAMEGTKIYYLSGNHDEFIRNLAPFYTGNIFFKDQLHLKLHGKTYLFFHGDVFDYSVSVSPFIAHLGGLGYDTLIRFNTFLNRLRLRFGLERISFAHRIKTKIKHAIQFIHSFEEAAINYGKQLEVDAVVCGHIHKKKMEKRINENKTIEYYNSGDWVENMSALEFKEGCWSIFRYDELDFLYLRRRFQFKEDTVESFNQMIEHDDSFI